MFKANIQKHLLGGLLEWLTGAMGPIGITIPDDIFSLSGIFNLVLQVLGVGWDMLRMKSVKMMGEPAVNALETGADAGFTVFQKIKTGGIMGIWEFIKEKFGDLKEMVIDAIKDMLITQVIEAGIKWLLSLLIPGAGFIKAIMAIKDVIVFFVESAIMLIPALIEAILALAAGSVAAVAKAIEFGLGRLIPLVIGLLANLIGLGGLSKKVMKIFKKIRKRVDKAVNKLLAKAKKAARKIMRKLGIGSKEKPKNKEQHDEQVKAGLTYLKQQSTKVDDDNDKALTQIEAQKAANKTMSKFKVFKSITPIEKSGKWSFHWKASDGVLDTNLALEGNEGATNKIRIKRKTINFDKVTIDGTVLESKTSELRRQLGNQEKAINEMQVETWIERRNTFISNQTENDNNSTIRKRIKRDLRIAWLNLYEQRLLSKGFTQNKIEQLAVKFSNSLTDAEYFRILHNPDRVAGGKAKLEYQAGTIVVSQNDKVILSDVLRQLKVIGDNKVNGHIGGQWKTRVPLLHNHVLPIYNSASSENKPKLQMSVTLKIK